VSFDRWLGKVTIELAQLKRPGFDWSSEMMSCEQRTLFDEAVCSDAQRRRALAKD